MIYSYADLQNKAIALINAMIFTGPENEQALHLLLILLAPEPKDDLDLAVFEADEMISKFLEGLEGLANQK